MGGKFAAGLFAAGLAVAGLSVASTASASDGGPVVRTDKGPVRGTSQSGYRVFQGIPYAAPPVGKLRWRPPQPAHRWKQVRDATKPGNRCAQGQSFVAPSYTEDCLYLNVTTPSTPGRKPVMVWLHGGGNSYGAGSDYDPRPLAVGGNVVVVTVNYRLGVFGYFGYKGLPDGGDFGFEDQQAALRWVQRNAASFGGDPRDVTLFGQSGGSFDVCGQLASPSARGLFQRAIMHSGSCASTWPENGNGTDSHRGGAFQSLADGRKAADALVKAHCADTSNTLSCMRAVPAKELVPTGNVLTTVNYGGPILPENPQKALAEGRFSHIPVMSGTTRDEERFQAAFVQGTFDATTYAKLLDTAFGAQAPAVAAQYPVGAPPAYRLTWATLLTDRAWSCPQLATDRALARWTPTYGFEFADRQAPTPFPPYILPKDMSLGAYHTSDLMDLFDQPGLLPFTFTPAQQRLSDEMIGYWSRFAWTGDPNGHGLPHWSRFGPEAVQALAPDDIHQVDLGQEHNCGFWSHLGA